ncbi:MAG: ABC transporter substrate-binding protein, partial [Allobaculum sp.]|nr:ABC transporter substrate-binding protein [Allobaculum sp.]
MTRRLYTSWLCLIACFCVLLAGCHGAQKTTAFEVPEELDTSKTIEISFWAKNDTNKRQTEVYKKEIAEFEKLYTNIKVNLKLYT